VISSQALGGLNLLYFRPSRWNAQNAAAGRARSPSSSPAIQTAVEACLPVQRAIILEQTFHISIFKTDFEECPVSDRIQNRREMLGTNK